ncbi:MAG: octaprenyl diphosphate synthase [Gammaproteobacteria bacterium]|jgi:octaprenyl-diphosphate synthase|nr:octaprenyl diphosphate synthase [Gammaproteobacteria bacterium]
MQIPIQMIEKQKRQISLEKVYTLIKDDLAQLESQIEANIQAGVDLIPKVIRHIVDSGGKRLRPMLTILCAKALAIDSQQHIILAAIVEFIHTATLLHDDVVDTSDMRRGKPTANVIWGNSAGILVGDFLYSRAFQMINNLRNWQISDIFANTTSIIAEGEALQLTHRNNPDVTDAYYFEVIRCKTAVLFAAAAQLGGVASGAPADIQKVLYDYGLHLGMAFQMVDDVLDYVVSSKEMGKNVGDDLFEGKATLPLIYAMKYVSKADAQIIKTAIQQGGRDDFSTILSMIQNTPVFDEINTLAHQEIQKAQAALHILPQSPYKEALLELSELAVERRG